MASLFMLRRKGGRLPATLVLVGSSVSRLALKKALEADDRTRPAQLLVVADPNASWRMLRNIPNLVILQEEDTGLDSAIPPLDGEIGPRVRYRIDRVKMAIEETARRLSMPLATPTWRRPMLPHGGEIGGPSGA